MNIIKKYIERCRIGTEYLKRNGEDQKPVGRRKIYLFYINYSALQPRREESFSVIISI